MHELPAVSQSASSGGILAGRVGGAVLAAMRKDIRLTQEDLAERLRVSPTTVQAWERGRKPLVNMSFARLQDLRRELDDAGANPELLFLWGKALETDVTLAALETADPERHPLARVVPDRTATELLAWPLSGQPPRQLADANTSLAVGRGELATVTAALREVADEAGADGERPAMLRRQVKYLLAKAEDPIAQQWAADAERSDLRSPRELREWTPSWPAARSAAHVAAAAGDLDPLHRFIDKGLSDDRLIRANLNYWAYWSGEYIAPWNGDSAMIEASDAWNGTRLLGTLLDGIVHAPYRDLCAHSLWALLLYQRQLVTNPDRRSQVQSAVSAALDAGRLAPSARQRLEQVDYLLRST